jgi:hypothetical protein
MLLGYRDDDELSSVWKPEVLLELEGKCEEEWYIGARRQLGARRQRIRSLHLRSALDIFVVLTKHMKENVPTHLSSQFIFSSHVCLFATV